MGKLGVPDRKSEGSADEAAFKRVIGYFLDHEKPKDEPKKKARKPAKPRKKPSTKPKKRA